MALYVKIIKLVLLLINIPLVLKANNKKKAVLKHIGFRPIKRRRFIILKKLYRFLCIGKVPFINRTQDFMIGVYQGHKIGLFNYQYASSIKSTVIIISLKQSLPKFVLKPKSFISRFFKLDSNKINIHHKRFSDSYVLLAQARYRYGVTDLFKQNVLDYFVTNDNLWVESDGYKLLIFDPNEMLFNGEKLDAMLDRALWLKELLSDGRNETIENDKAKQTKPLGLNHNILN